MPETGRRQLIDAVYRTIRMSELNAPGSMTRIDLFDVLRPNSLIDLFFC